MNRKGYIAITVTVIGAGIAGGAVLFFRSEQTQAVRSVKSGIRQAKLQLVKSQPPPLDVQDFYESDQAFEDPDQTWSDPDQAFAK